MTGIFSLVTFVQVDGRLARNYEGAGLGLALTRRLAEMHGGRVSVHSAGSGQGSRFTLTLPWHPANTSPRPAGDTSSVNSATPPPPPGQPRAVLVADDNEANLMAVSGFVELLSARVVTAGNGREALAVATAALPDLILRHPQ